ncbi:MAG TPA: glycosyltransferase [Ramlibacter sp.]|nr:glycosyltransferase [Ramlibacter sp.]
MLTRAGLRKAGACWRDGKAIEIRCFCLDGNSARMRVVVATEASREVHEVPEGAHLRIEPSNTSGVYSIAFENGPLLQGSPISFDEPASIPQPGAIEPGVDVIVPVYRNAQGVKACLRSLLDSLPHNRTPARVIVVNDASPEPALVLWLESLAAAGHIELLHNEFNLGFIESVNRALRHGRRDALMLNSDTLVHGNWIDRLHAALGSAPDVASVMPWSNNAEIGSLAPRQVETHCSEEDLAVIDSAAARLHAAGETADMQVPTTIGFAMLMRRKVLDGIGGLDGAAMTRGYLEEVDWCLRARAAGFRHMLATGVFVVHEGSASFGPEKQLRVRQNQAVISARYPHYNDEYIGFLRTDPLGEPRRKLLHAIAAAGATWPGTRDAVKPRIDPRAALKSEYRRIAVWDLDAGGGKEAEVLALARRLASESEDAKTRLLVFGFASEALRHTGVVDVIPPAGNREEVLPDHVLASLAGCDGPA